MANTTRTVLQVFSSIGVNIGKDVFHLAGFESNSQVVLRRMCGRLWVVRDFGTLQCWSEQPCVRPLNAGHLAAGHNAFRGSGPHHKLAFDCALAQVGCPDHLPCKACFEVSKSNQ